MPWATGDNVQVRGLCTTKQDAMGPARLKFHAMGHRRQCSSAWAVHNKTRRDGPGTTEMSCHGPQATMFKLPVTMFKLTRAGRQLCPQKAFPPHRRRRCAAPAGLCCSRWSVLLPRPGRVCRCWGRRLPRYALTGAGGPFDKMQHART
jgi:hypothetical protein